MKNKLLRLSKIISHAGVCSRKHAEILVKNGEVKINDKIFKEFAIEKDRIKSIKVKDMILDRQPVRLWLFNKPIGYVSSNKEQFSQKSLFKLLPKYLPRVVSVGRLDIQTQGLMILTNNPTLSTYLENPKNQIKRKYIVKVSGQIPAYCENFIEKNILINGVYYRNISLKVLDKELDNSILEIILTEGKNREIRKVLNHFGLEVKKLVRISFGPFKLEALKDGAVSEVKESILEKFLESIGFDYESYLWKI